MTPDDMYEEPKNNPMSDKRVFSLWPQAAGELWAYSNVLHRKGMSITAEQIRMAVTLADEAFQTRKRGSH